jgi:hypothetical protein
MTESFDDPKTRPGEAGPTSNTDELMKGTVS